MTEGGRRARSERRAGRARVRLPGGRRAGVHLPHGGGLLKAANRAADIGASAFQIFSDNPTSWRRRSEPPAALPELRARLAAADLQLAIHAAYLVNLAGPVDELFARSVEVLAHELAVAPAYGASFVNVHIGSHRRAGIEAGIARVVEGVARALDGAAAERESVNGAGDAMDAAADPPPGASTGATTDATPSPGPLPVLLLENGSGGGDGIGVTLEELEALLTEAGRRGLDGSFRFCLDTAHLWGAGYDISTARGVDDVIDEFDRRIGLDRLALVHFNDSLSARGSRHDRHTHIGAGQIGLEGMGRLVSHPALDHVTFLLETPGTEEGYDAVNLRRMALLGEGRELPPLDAEAPGTGRPRSSRESAA